MDNFVISSNYPRKVIEIWEYLSKMVAKFNKLLWSLIYERKTRVQKSHATVPLINIKQFEKIVY